MLHARRLKYSAVALTVMGMVSTPGVPAQGVDIVTVALANQTAPGIDETFDELSPLGAFEVPIINPSGVIVFRDGGFSKLPGFWTTIGGTLSALALAGDDAPGLSIRSRASRTR